LQVREMHFWCLAPLPKGEEPRRKLRSEEYQPPAAVLLENYQSDSSVEADEDTDQEVGGDVASHPTVSSATKPGRKTRAATAKQLTMRAATKGEATKTAKLEDDKKKRKSKESPPLAVRTPTIPTSTTKEVEEDEDEAPPVIEDRTVTRLRSPAARRQQELEQQVNEEYLRQMREAQRATTGTHAKLPVKIRVRPLRPKLGPPITMW
jgi:hypothetical protein